MSGDGLGKSDTHIASLPNLPKQVRLLGVQTIHNEETDNNTVCRN